MSLLILLRDFVVAAMAGWSDSPVEVRERRAMLDPSIGLSVEVRDVGVGHVEIATDADTEVTIE